ncbi:MAG: cobalt-precorrin 5A hydrolase [Bacillota bacterium]
MKIAVIALTPGGLLTARRICRLFARPFLFCHPGLREKGSRAGRGAEAPAATVATVAAAVAGRPTQGNGRIRQAYFPGDLRTFTAEIFACFDALILIMAAGIAVRLLAPCLRDKKTDPAVIVVDDTGRFAVSLLGGHQRGANDLAEKIASGIGATPVITTATDRRRLLAFDQLAQRRNWTLEHGEDMKKISAAQLEGAELCLYCDLPLAPVSPRDKGLELPAGCRLVRKPGMPRACRGTVLLSNRRELPNPPPGLPFVVIRPRNITAGVGCRRDVPGRAIIAAVQEALWQAGRVPQGLQALATIELKGKEKGLQEAARFFEVPLQLFSREQLQRVEHLFDTSSFVRRHTGVGAVAEPCAYLGSGGGSLILKKTGSAGITVALAECPLPLVLAQRAEGAC